MRGLTSFEARVLALLLLLAMVFPTMTKASEEGSTVVEIFAENTTLRGSNMTIMAVVTGDQNVTVRWHLPAGIEVLNGSLEQDCSGECVFEIMTQVDSNSTLGPKDIGVEVEYA